MADPMRSSEFPGGKRRRRKGPKLTNANAMEHANANASFKRGARPPATRKASTRVGIPEGEVASRKMIGTAPVAPVKAPVMEVRKSPAAPKPPVGSTRPGSGAAPIGGIPAKRTKMPNPRAMERANENASFKRPAGRKRTGTSTRPSGGGPLGRY